MNKLKNIKNKKYINIKKVKNLNQSEYNIKYNIY